jgi:hypothetical protein
MQAKSLNTLRKNARNLQTLQASFKELPPKRPMRARARTRTGAHVLLRHPSTHPPTHTPHTHSDCVSKGRRGRTRTWHRPVAVAKTPAPDRAMAASHVHAHFCVHALNVAPVHVFVNQIQHWQSCKLRQAPSNRASAAATGRNWKTFWRALNFEGLNFCDKSYKTLILCAIAALWGVVT